MLELVLSSAFKTEVKKIKNTKDKAELKIVLDFRCSKKMQRICRKIQTC